MEFKSIEDVREYYKSIEFDVEIKEAHKTNSRQYFLLIEFCPYDGTEVNLIYIKNGKLYNTNDDDIVKIFNDIL